LLSKYFHKFNWFKFSKHFRESPRIRTLRNATRHHAKIWFKEKHFQTRRPANIRNRHELGNGQESGRGAALGKIFNSRAENGKSEVPGCLNYNGWLGDDDFAGCGFDFAVGERRDRTMMIRFVRVVVNHFVQRRARGHRVQQQDDAHQQGGQGRFANLEKMFPHVLQIICKLANGVPPARLIFGVKSVYFSVSTWHRL
jgi:hypothetical protein